MLATDNGAAFTSGEFQEFVEHNGIRHITSSPYHPATNGLVERAVQTNNEENYWTTGYSHQQIPPSLPSHTTALPEIEDMMRNSVYAHNTIN